MSMKKYRVFVKVSEILEATVEAESEEEAWQLAQEMDGGEFDAGDERNADWHIYDVRDEEETSIEEDVLAIIKLANEIKGEPHE